MITVSQLNIYPIKSLGGISLPHVHITDRGFEYDRRWMLIDNNNRFLSQRELSKMALLRLEIGEIGLEVFHQDDKTDALIIPFFTSANERITVDIWGIKCEALLVNAQADKWFSRILQTHCRLVYMEDDTKILIDQKYNVGNRLTNFSDGYPILMISESSLHDLNNRSTEPLPMNRFRPNIVVSDCDAFEEDSMKQFEINGIRFYGVKPSARCVVTTIDQANGTKGKEPLKTLATYRSINNKIYFGENVIADSIGKINVGDELKVLERKKALFSY